jgi:hypothetical protein
MGCLTSVSFIVLVNGVASNLFRPTRGLKQGYLLSPCLFLLIVEGLSRSPLEAKRERLLKGIRIGGDLFLTNLIFVDDILFFTSGPELEGRKLKEILLLFGKATRMKINVLKSTIILMNWRGLTTYIKETLSLYSTCVGWRAQMFGLHFKTKWL